MSPQQLIPLPPPPPPPVQNAPDIVVPGRYLSGPFHGKDTIFEIRYPRRHILRQVHAAQAADFEEYKWLFQYGDSDKWYFKPTKSQRHHWARQELSGRKADEIPAVEEVMPITFEQPILWASAALTTPPDDDIYDCGEDHSGCDDFSGRCQTCTDEKSEALESTDLEYCVVMSALQGHAPGCPHPGRKMYMMARCGSREAAATQAFHYASLGSHVVFSCVFRLGESFEDRIGPVARVEELWNLAEEAENDEVIRVFY
ncbi:hypothetical protein BU24DRAFT_263552 [Aaosphaeria arxii CBS 175.79]|uniref:Uncharacterized protein n=1 Tax=Aaosphaeria arxii CBS 175.79 TaxID=1450172 RepID=A0A6A5XJL1_9PLEO|nr:uncharacterized protein BU24DRAFT_263552 [Aaosphaeria arxii CBS 175.79]KAF2013066.1 hypothetical protein BU24DRAFT_263552 [Aaosphaeria arxii CBS 175.79]